MSKIPKDVARERLLDQVFDARTAAEIAVAREALRDWITAHPDEPGMSDAFEVLSHRGETAEMDRRQTLLEALNEDFAALRERPDEWTEEIEERRLWEQTLSDGLGKE